MWDMHSSCENKSKEALEANGRKATQHDLVAAIPDIYYKDTDAPIVVDKHRSWTYPANMDLLKKYVTDKPKVIVLTRPIAEILQSFGNLHKRRAITPGLANDLLAQGSEPIMRPFEGVKWTKENNNGEFLFVSYADLVENTKETLDRIYAFCEWEPFEHDLINVINTHPEDDVVYGLLGLHDIRPKVKRRKLEVFVPADILKRCQEMDDELDSYGIS